MRKFWFRGQMAEVARLAGMAPSHLSAVLHRRRSVTKERAVELEAASKEVLGFPIPLRDWLFNRYTTHPAFFGKGV